MVFHGGKGTSVVAPGGLWTAQCPADGTPAIAVVDIDNNPGNLARPWRRTALASIYAPHQVGDDPRSNGRDMF